MEIKIYMLVLDFYCSIVLSFLSYDKILPEIQFFSSDHKFIFYDSIEIRVAES